MAVRIYYKPMGAIEVKKNSIYTSDNITTAADTVELLRGVRIVDASGNETPLRGLRVLITSSETAAVTKVPNVAYVWKEGTTIAFGSGYTYEFLDSGIIGYGAEVKWYTFNKE